MNCELRAIVTKNTFDTIYSGRNKYFLNCFTQISDWQMAQKLSERINPEDLHKVLDILAKRYCPVVDELKLCYQWTIQQIECSTDTVFLNREILQPIYSEIIKTAVFSVDPDNIATFLGKRITYNCAKEVGTNYNQRILGTRIKHHMGDVSIKMYDKFGVVLRIESTCNNVGEFRVLREIGHQKKVDACKHFTQARPASAPVLDRGCSSWHIKLEMTDYQYYSLYKPPKPISKTIIWQIIEKFSR